MSVFSMTPTCVGKSCSIKFLATPTKKRNVYEGDNQIGEKKNKYSYEVKLLKSLAPPLMTALIAFSPIVNPPVNLEVGVTIRGQRQHVYVEYYLLQGMTPTVLSKAKSDKKCSTAPVSVGQTIDVQKGAALFNKACIGCHYAGGNIIQPGATLFLKDLERNGVDTEEEIYRLTYYGKGRMPGFGQNCTPRGQCTFGPRLQDDEIKLLAEFVKSQADQGWPKIENSGD
ncbi:cytochrome c6, chloroplastic isoform X1 [Nicotiana tabacum]|uniref:Cytochrome c6, chloroplastic isoform X1 n=1 Tax=Nicotiana tabacum TaxID=4097 RepID=A0AC58T1W3_TOBAC